MSQPRYYPEDFKEMYPAHLLWIMLTVGIFLGFSLAVLLYGIA